MSQLVDQSLGKPIQGVSQQAESLRGNGQCNEQINFIPDPVVGLRRRPPTQAKLSIDTYDIYVDYVDSAGDKVLCVGNSKVDIYNPDDNTITNSTILTSTAYDYIVANLIAGNKRSVSFVEDALYISNPNVTVAEDTGFTPPTRLSNIGIVYCLGGQYSREYRIDVKFTDGTSTSSTFTTPDGTSTAHQLQIQSTYVIGQLNVAPLSTDVNLDVTVHLDHLLITTSGVATKTIASITCSDDEGGLALKCAYNSVKAITDLPEFAPVSAILTVAGEAGDDDDSYFEFTTPTDTATGLGTFGTSGVWVETVKAGDEFEFDATTLPVKLVLNSGVYELDLVAWKGREIGDDSSNETPSILDKTVRDITSIQGRLGLLSEDSVIFSRVKRPSELWRRSIIGGLSNDDAIDGSGDASTGVHTHFAKVAQDLAVFTKQGQYVILGNTAITPDNINLTLTTRNTSIDSVSPVGVEGNLYYVTDNGDFMGVKEYFKDELTFFSLPISSHIPRYISGEATLFKGSNPQRMLALQTDSNAKLLYCYKFIFAGKKRVQSAWFKFEFNDDIKHFFFTSNSLVIITDDGSNHQVERLDFDAINTGGLEFEVHLDRSKEYTLDVDNKITPDDIHKGAEVLFVSLDSSSAGLPVSFTDNGDGTYTMLSGESGDTVVAGYRYTSTYSPTAPRVFDRKNEVIQTGQLNVLNLLVNASNSGVFSWSIDTIYNTSTSGDLTNRVWNAQNNLIGSEPLFTKQWRIPWRGKSTDKACTLTCDRHTPLNISYIEFTGDLRRTRKRI